MFGPFWNLYDKTNLSFIFLLKEKYKDLIKNIINKNSWGWNVTHLCTQPIPKNACACMHARTIQFHHHGVQACMRQATRSHERTRTPARISTTCARMHAIQLPSGYMALPRRWRHWSGSTCVCARTSAAKTTIRQNVVWGALLSAGAVPGHQKWVCKKKIGTGVFLLILLHSV